MSGIAEIVDILENNIQKLFNKIAILEEKNANLVKELHDTASTIENQSLEIKKLKEDYESLKIVNSLLGSEDFKRDTKLKINSLIREIDNCIAQLSD